MRSVLGILLLTLLVSSAHVGSPQAGEGKLSAEEVRTLLSGNTAVGDWKGSPYRQHFEANGKTLYLAEGSDPSPGKWKAEEASGDYCSWWQGSGWDCYGIEHEGAGYVFVVKDGDGYRGPFTVVEGKQL